MRRAATTVPRKRAEAADDDDDEGEEQRVAAHQVVRLADRHDEDGGERGEAGAEAEDDGIDPVDVDAEGGRGLAVPLGRAHDEADAGAGEQRPDRGEDHDRGEGDDRELVAGVAEPGSCSCQSNGAATARASGP